MRLESATVGVLAIAAGVVWLLEIVGVVAIPGKALASILLMVIGAAIVVTARSGRPRWPLVVGAALVLGLAASSAPGLKGIGDQTIVPASANELAQSYHLSLGDTRVDLTRIEDLSALPGRTLAIHVGAGSVRVFVPPDLPITLSVHVGAGDAVVCGRRLGSGLGVRRTTLVGPPTDARVQRFALDLRVSMGEIAVVCEGQR